MYLISIAAQINLICAEHGGNKFLERRLFCHGGIDCNMCHGSNEILQRIRYETHIRTQLNEFFIDDGCKHSLVARPAIFLSFAQFHLGFEDSAALFEAQYLLMTATRHFVHSLIEVQRDEFDVKILI